MFGDRVCIIIPNYNGGDFLHDCIDSILSNTNYNYYDITVVDNGSTDNSGQVINRFDDVKCIQNDVNLGVPIACNQAIYNSPDYDWYLLLNNDTEVHDNWLYSMLRTGNKNQSAGIVGAKLLFPDGTIQHAGAEFRPGEKFHVGYGEPNDNFTNDRMVEYVTGAAFLIDSDVIETVGYLDEMLSPAYYEETDYCQRAYDSGFKTFYSADAIITHHESKTTNKLPEKYLSFIHNKNRIKYVLLNEDITTIADVFKNLGYEIVDRLNSYHIPSPELNSIGEVITDLNQIISKRKNREQYIPSYYCQENKNYMNRYNWLN
jgi:GT2 family glycosyltransferase